MTVSRRVLRRISLYRGSPHNQEPGHEANIKLNLITCFFRKEKKHGRSGIWTHDLTQFQLRSVRATNCAIRPTPNLVEKLHLVLIGENHMILTWFSSPVAETKRLLWWPTIYSVARIIMSQMKCWWKFMIILAQTKEKHNRIPTPTRQRLCAVTQS